MPVLVTFPFPFLRLSFFVHLVFWVGENIATRLCIFGGDVIGVLSDYSVLALFSRPDVKQWLPDVEVPFLDQAVAFLNEVEEFYNDILVLRRDSVSPNDLAKGVPQKSSPLSHLCAENVPLRVSGCLVLCLYDLFSTLQFAGLYIRLRKHILFCSTVKWR